MSTPQKTRTNARQKTMQSQASKEMLSPSQNQLFRPEYQMEHKQSFHQERGETEKVWNLMNAYQKNDKESLQQSIVNHIEYTLARTRFDFQKFHCYQALSHSVRDRLMEEFNDTQLYFHEKDPKRVYYLSLEFLIGRCLQNALINLDLEDEYKEALLELGYYLEELVEEEVDPALGNGGLGRLAACFLDSMATMNYPGWGYGLRYSYGIFKQLIKDGYQIEQPDYWLTKGNPWEIERLDVQYPVRFYGTVKKVWDHGVQSSLWEGGVLIRARAFDTPIPGYNTFNTISLRLWKSCPNSEFDFSSFNTGDYNKALEERQSAEYITSVLYPNDSTPAGKELRLKQQYLLVSATCQDIVRRFKRRKVVTWTEFPTKNILQLNDTHPALAIVELLRILVDVEGLDQPTAWQITKNSFAYTNHTVLPEALEKWGVDLIGKLLPRHLEIIYQINFLFLEKVAARFPGNEMKMRNMSIIEEGDVKRLRMANLSIIGSTVVNGVAKIHSDLLTTTIFKDFYEMNPNKFQNKTNGVTPRRWVRCANPKLAALYDRICGNDSWTLDMTILRKFENLASDAGFQAEFQEIKKQNKLKFVQWIGKTCNIELNPDSLFDIMVKRIHEYKRQFMNALYIIHRYLRIRAATPEERKQIVPRTICFGGKSAPAYVNAKRIIKFINSVAEVVNNDPTVGDLLKVVFMPNYNVSNAQIIIPASELSQHISTAGTEASGTSNMKFCMNGCLIIGTLDGANVEIAEEVGDDNIFIFGAKVDEIEELRKKMHQSEANEYFPPELLEVFQEVENGRFGHIQDIKDLISTVRLKNDNYLLGADFKSYLAAQERVDKCYLNKQEWAKMAILNSLRSGKFSSDRTIKQYAEEIWKIEQVRVPDPSLTEEGRLKGKSFNHK